MTLLTVSDLTKKGEGDFLLTNITFSQRRLEKIAIAGETGAGKSTLLKLIAGLIQPDGGQLVFEKQKINGPDDQLVPGHPGIAYLSQHFELQKSLRVEQVLTYSNNLSEKEAETLYQVCQIDHLMKRRTDQLSGGEKQRIAICRLLISYPRLLLLDEPFSHLDMVHKNTLKTVIRDIGEKLMITCMLVSHDPMDTLSWADKILVMKDGQIKQSGDPETVYRQPVDEYAGGLFGKYTIVQPKHFRRFARLRGVKTIIAGAGKRSILLRPEDIKLGRETAHSLKAKVQSVFFFGDHYEAEVLTGNQILIINTGTKSINAGDTVFINSVRGKGWYVE